LNDPFETQSSHRNKLKFHLAPNPPSFTFLQGQPALFISVSIFLFLCLHRKGQKRDLKLGSSDFLLYFFEKTIEKCDNLQSEGLFGYLKRIEKGQGNFQATYSRPRNAPSS